MKEEFKKIIFDALRKVDIRNVDIYTFCLYHDHESHIVSVCIDTLENSKRSAISSNEYRKKYFHRYLEEGDIGKAQRWNASGGRSFSLGDYSYKNISEIDTHPDLENDGMYISMFQAISEMSELISRQSTHGKELVYCCSTKDSEVGLIWT